MSIRIMTAIWDNADVAGAELLMLLALADHANDDGWCWPSQARLAKKARIKTRHAADLIADLAERRWIFIEAQPGKVSHYKVPANGVPFRDARGNLADPCTPVQGCEKPTPAPQNRGTPAPQNRGPLHPSAEEPSVTTTLTTRGDPPLEMDFTAGINAPSARKRPPLGNSRSAGERTVAYVRELNDKLDPITRRKLAEALLAENGLAPLVAADECRPRTNGDARQETAGERAYSAADDAAITLHDMGLTEPRQIAALAASWRAETWQGRKGETPTTNQLLAFASQQQAAQTAAPAPPAEGPAIPETFPGLEVTQCS